MEDYNLYDIAGVSDGGKGDKKKPADSSPNFTYTKDPNTRIGKYGVVITQDQLEKANKNGYAWKDLDAYADWLGSWAHPVKPQSISPFYRAYGGQPNINGFDVEQQYLKNDPKINEILNRNIAPKGEVPMFASDDADVIRKLIANDRAAAGLVNKPTPVNNAEVAASVAKVINK